MAPSSPVTQGKLEWRPITVAQSSTARTVSVRLNTQIMGSNPTRGVDVSMHAMVQALRWADPPFRGHYRLRKVKETENVAKAQQRHVEPMMM